MTDDDARPGLKSFPQGYRALVVGSEGSIGRAFAELLQADPACAEVRCIHRRSSPPLDYDDEGQVSALAQALASEDKFHLIIIATGLLHRPDFGPEKKLGDLDYARMEAVFRANTFGPALLMSKLVRRLDAQRGVLAVLSAKVGSIGDNRLGGWYSYRASKAALNMMLKTAAIEVRRTQAQSVLIALHPGTVTSALSRPFGGENVGRPPKDAVWDMLNVLDGLKPEDSGSFVSFQGESCPGKHDCYHADIMDGQPDQDKAGAGDDKSLAVKPIYPFAGPPARGQTIEVVPGVRWIRMPLPYALDHINLWALDDGEGWAVVDTGTRTDETGVVWRELMNNSPDQRPLTRVFVTHMHPDHVGMAGWFTRKFGVRLWMTRLEYLHCRVMMSDTGREAPPDGIDFYRRIGWAEPAIETYRLRFGNFGKHIHAMPDSFRRIQDGEEIRIGANLWRVVVGNGHSPEHACLYCPELKVLISGDQVLPRISSNVSVHPTEPDANPMNDWMNSLAKIRREVPDDVLVLPAHGEVFRGLHARLDRLERGQNIAFDRLRRTLTEPRRVQEVFSALFARAISPQDVGLLSMATGEAMACLNYLLFRGEITKTLGDDGVYCFVMKDAATKAQTP